ncbi:hypothetical protein H6F76_09040 [Leptolyngbya sp. FACHB-321]|uniref:WD40 repeat domain-containing protein n=1 Tax=Leptolyngbya sp. FACHB-321 TaxID=2692807 RepID=UPI001682901E|nr:hypothetical protein [Leptolyngbya sp. FACHB-321]MBD2035172.1 hypothetical protein [Leptolyngbya sp. FACHB-321]
MAVGVHFGAPAKFSLIKVYEFTAAADGIVTFKETLEFQHQKIVYSVFFSSNSKYLATASLDGTTQVVDLTAQRVITHLKHGATHYAIFMHDEKYLITGDNASPVRVWNIAT